MNFIFINHEKTKRIIIFWHVDMMWSSNLSVHECPLCPLELHHALSSTSCLWLHAGLTDSAKQLGQRLSGPEA